jgi:hypothetical protein
VQRVYKAYGIPYEHEQQHLNMTFPLLDVINMRAIIAFLAVALLTYYAMAEDNGSIAAVNISTNSSIMCDADTLGSTVCREGAVYQCVIGPERSYSYQHMVTCRGRCVPELGVCTEPGHDSCKKTGGRDPYFRGETLVDSAGILDSCADDKTLIETYCNAYTLIAEAQSCEWGCREGACLKGKRLLCENSVTTGWHRGECSSCPAGYSLRACESKGWLFVKRREVCYASRITQCGPSPLCDSGWTKTDTLECLPPQAI